MRRRLLALGAALALASLVFSFSRGAVPAPSASGPPGPPRPAAGASTPEGTQLDPLPPPPERDIFRYAEHSTPPPSSGRPRERPPAVIEPARPAGVDPPPPAVRLVGLVHRPGGLRAAVSTSGGVVIVGPGDVVEGLTVVGIDEDRGLRLRAPDGTEVALLPGG